MDEVCGGSIYFYMFYICGTGGFASQVLLGCLCTNLFGLLRKELCPLFWFCPVALLSCCTVVTQAFSGYLSLFWFQLTTSVD